MTVEFKTKHITSLYRAALDAERVEGKSWYATAREIAATLDPTDPSRAAAVIAVLSPRVHWDRNVRMAAEVYAGITPGCLKANANKARRIVDGEDPDSVVSGPKVRAFWHAIVNPSDPRAIVVDRHALDIAAGQILDDETRGRMLGRKGAYDGVCRLYTRAAGILSREYGQPVSAVQVQATTWVAWRRMKAAHGL
jgi:hypothetical protein